MGTVLISRAQKRFREGISLINQIKAKVQEVESLGGGKNGYSSGKS
ncbi:MAG: hypothetical protein ACFFA4_10170 [Promethearchaeota archaeon]